MGWIQGTGVAITVFFRPIWLGSAGRYLCADRKSTSWADGGPCRLTEVAPISAPAASSARRIEVPKQTQKLPGGAYLVAEQKDGRIEVDEAIVSAVLDHPEKDHASN